MSESALATLDLDSSTLDEITERLQDESAGSAAGLIDLMLTFTANAGVTVDMGELPGETLEMRRSHVTLLVALIDHTRACLADIFRSIDLDGRIPDADMLDPVNDGFSTAGEALAAIVDALRNPREGR